MADNSVTDFRSLINQQIHFLESILEYLVKAQVLINVALGENSLTCNDVVTYTYLWVLDDVIDNAKNTNEHSLNVLLRALSIYIWTNQEIWVLTLTARGRQSFLLSLCLFVIVNKQCS